MDWDAYLAEEYVPVAEERVAIYRRMAGMERLTDLEELREELKDRFGVLPEPARNLLAIVDLRLRGQVAGVEKILLREGLLHLVFRKGLTPEKVKALVEGVKQPLEFVSTTKESGVRVKLISGKEAEGAKDVLRAIGGPA